MGNTSIATIFKVGPTFLVGTIKSLLFALNRFISRSICSTILAYFTLSSAIAAPEGSNIVGGAGNIASSGLTTTINQNTSSLAIDWNSFDVNQNEIVNFVQPGQSSVALNQILDNSASQIHGQINANGHIVLVNPNGLFFGQNSTLNVGGLIASGLSINTQDFMNGDYIFNELEGANGAVINQGIINASLGGNVALIGKQVKNQGVINAKLGSVNLAAGKEAVLTFDQQGLLGVRVSKAILQDELGIDPAVLNEGEINAEGGRVLLTASISRDVFSEAVNHNGLEQVTSVVVNEDGSFTLGGGADVVNTGEIDVSAKENNSAGQVVMLGENVTHTGSIHADSKLGTAGQIELHAMSTTELREEAIISAQAKQAGSGGGIKLLGENVGLFDNAEVNASGINGGGEILVGGDRQGLNVFVRNAEFIYLSEGSNIFADAIADGNGGRIITYADDTGRFYGGIYARGGAYGGNGGFIETSGKKGFQILKVPDVSSTIGEGGTWLIDPYDITINNLDANFNTSGGGSTVYTSTGTPASIDIATIVAALGSGDVEIVTDPADSGMESGNIIFDAVLDYNGTGSNSLTLDAAGGITFTISSSITDSDTNNIGDQLSLNFVAAGAIQINSAAPLVTQGGDVTFTGTSITAGSIDAQGAFPGASNDGSSGGNISLISTGNIALTGSANSSGSAGGGSGNNDGGDAGTIDIQAYRTT